jgi:preprotein translocase subunit SecE
MDKKVQDRPTFLDTLKLLGAAGILIAAIAFFYVFPDVSVLIRAFTMLVAALAAGFVALQSFRGQAFWKFVQASRVELRKVVWPTREETIQTTIAVFIFAMIMGVFFWLLDLSLLYLTGKLTGQGG